MYRLHHWQPRNWAEARTMLGNDDGNGGGGGNNQNRLSAAELLARHGASAERLAEKLEEAYGNNFTLREKNRGLTTEVEGLKAKQAPEGAVILTGEAAKAYDAYKALGKPDEVKARLEAGDVATGEVATLKRDGTLRDAATAAGYKFSVLKDRVTVAGNPAIEVREVEEDGKKVSRAFVKPEGGNEQELTAYAAAQWADYLPSLTATQDGGQGGGNGQQQGNGVTYPAQRGSNAQKPLSGPQVAASYVTNTYPGPPKRG